VARIEVGRGELALGRGSPQVLPAPEACVLHEIGAVSDGVDIGPRADVIGADPRLRDQIPGVRHLAEIERLVETIVGVKPADMRRGERDVAFGIALGKLLFVEPIDRAAGDVLDRNAGLGGELLGDDIGDHVAPAAAPDADDKLVLRRGRHRP
jgi:hypothetical protein